jgi:hypothetical protein
MYHEKIDSRSTIPSIHLNCHVAKPILHISDILKLCSNRFSFAEFQPAPLSARSSQAYPDD